MDPRGDPSGTPEVTRRGPPGCLVGTAWVLLQDAAEVGPSPSGEFRRVSGEIPENSPEGEKTKPQKSQGRENLDQNGEHKPTGFFEFALF